MREGCKNNINGTKALLSTAQEFRVKNFVLISTDKAVRSTSIMGASKRVCELMCLSAAQKKEQTTKICIVRFGNVLGSSGSVIPEFEKQVDLGGPVVVTKKVERYFMSIAG